VLAFSWLINCNKRFVTLHAGQPGEPVPESTWLEHTASSWCHTVSEPEVRVNGMETTVSWVHALSGKLGPRMKPAPPDSGWNPAIFLVLFLRVLFRVSEGNKGIYTDVATGCQLIWIVSASASVPLSEFS